ncbi:MAG: lamin tail domain-containing protein [Akkermansiaceae bacterium]
MKSLIVLTACALPLAAQLRLTEVMSDSAHPGGPTNGDWFEITNTGTTAVNIGGYSFDDSTPIPGRVGQIFPTHVIPAGGSVIVLREDTSSSFRTTWSIDPAVRIFTTSFSELPNFPGLSGNGDAIFLFNPSNSVVDQYIFGAATTGTSFARFTDGNSVPGGVSVDGIFGAYTSNQASEDTASPGFAPLPPEPLPPIFIEPFSNVWITGNNLANSSFRIQAVDPNPGDLVTLTATSKPDWITFTDLGGGLGQLSGTATDNEIGVHEITVQAADNSGQTTPSTQVITVTIAPATSPIILNEYNGVSNSQYLGGGAQDDPDGASDLYLGREQGHGGDWMEFVVTGNPGSSSVDMRNWTIRLEGNDKVRVLKLSNHIALSAIPNGTILTFTDDRTVADTALPLTSNLNTAGHIWANIWMLDPILLDQAASIHPGGRTIGSGNTIVTLFDGSDQVVYGPIGESILAQDSNLNGLPDDPITVSDTETLRLEGTPSSFVSPIAVNYDDGNSSTFGAPNKWGTPELTQSFSAFIAPNTPPFFAGVPSRDAVRGEYSVTVPAASPGGLPLTFEALALPSFLTMTPSATSITISNNRPLTADDVGQYEVTITADNGSDENNLAFLVYELTVHNPSPALILNEYNAVAPDEYLNGGTLGAGEDGGVAAVDTHFGRIIGNGGDWFELVVVGDGNSGFSDLTGWTIEIGEGASGGVFSSMTTVTLTDPAIWSAVGNGTVLTFIGENTAGGGLDTEINRVNELGTIGYAWTNIHLGTPDFISVTNLEDFRTNSDNTQVLIKDASGNIIFGPAGEGVAPVSGIGNSEILELEDDPSPLVSSIADASSTTPGYDDGSSGSTFGSPNLFEPIEGPIGDRPQDFSRYILTPFQLYLISVGLPGALPDDDDDKDSFSNINEYLFGGNPNDARTVPYSFFDAEARTQTVDLRTSDPAYLFLAQRSTNLQNWSIGDVTTETAPSLLGDDFLRATLTYTGSELKIFLRFAASLAP